MCDERITAAYLQNFFITSTINITFGNRTEWIDHFTMVGA